MKIASKYQPESKGDIRGTEMRPCNLKILSREAEERKHGHCGIARFPANGRKCMQTPTLLFRCLAPFDSTLLKVQAMYLRYRDEAVDIERRYLISRCYPKFESSHCVILTISHNAFLI